MVYLVQTRTGGKSRRLTLDRHGPSASDQIRREAVRIIADIKAGREPVFGNGAATADAGPMVAEAAERYMREHVAVRCKPTTVRQCQHMLDKHLLPALGTVRLGEIGHERVANLHYSLHETPVMANEGGRHALAASTTWPRSGGSPPKAAIPAGLYASTKERNCERFFSAEEFRRLGRVLSEVEAEGKVCSSAVAAFRLLMLTGCRRNEILTLRWNEVGLEAGETHLPDTKTGACSVALSPAARTALAGIPRLPDNHRVIFRAKPGVRLSNHNNGWLVIRARVDLEDMRIRDLRHSLPVGVLRSARALPAIGKLLGRRKVQPMARYAHLARLGEIVGRARCRESLRVDLAGETVAPSGAP